LVRDFRVRFLRKVAYERIAGEQVFLSG